MPLSCKALRALRLLQRRAVPPTLAVFAAAGTACGSGAAPTPTASGPSTATPAPKLDQCVVGTWKGTGLSGTESYTSVGGGEVPMSGGAGDVMTIKADGSFSVDYSHEAPATGTGSDGAAYVITTTGTLDGTLTANGGELTQTFGSASSMHISVTRNGSAFRGGSLLSPQIQGYQCSAGKSLALTESGVTESWVPA